MKRKTIEEHAYEQRKLIEKYPAVKTVMDDFKNMTDAEIKTLWNIVNIEDWKR